MRGTLAASLFGCWWLVGCATGDGRYAQGQQLYATSCVSCHKTNGQGAPGIAPSLVGTSWVTGSPERLALISVYGIRGPIEVNGQPFNLEMPGVYYFLFDDEQMASVLTYIRQTWGNKASPVSAELVAGIRAELGPRDSFTVKELAELDR